MAKRAPISQEAIQAASSSPTSRTSSPTSPASSQLEAQLAAQLQEPDIALAMLRTMGDIQTSTAALETSLRSSATSGEGSSGRSRLDEIERTQKLLHESLQQQSETLRLMHLTLRDSKPVSLSGDGDGSSPASSSTVGELRAATQAMTAQTSASEALAQAVGQRGQVTIDAESLSGAVGRRLEQALDSAVEAHLRPVEARLAAIDQRMDSAGSPQLERLAERLEAHSTRISWAVALRGAALLALTLLPLAMIVLGLSVVLGLVVQVFGLEPIFSWLWTSFETAQAWWAKLLIAAGGLGLAGGTTWLVWRAGRWLAGRYALIAQEARSRRVG